MAYKLFVFLFFLIIFLYSGAFTNFKFFLMLITTVFPLIFLEKFNYFKAPLRVYICLFLWLFYFGLMLYVGIINGYTVPDLRFIFRWFILLPITFLFGYITYLKIKINDMHKLILVITSIIIIFSFGFFFVTYFGLLPDFRFIFPEVAFSDLDLSEGSLSLRQSNQTSMVFLLPFNIFYFIFSKDKQNNYSYLALLNIFLGIFLAAIGGRRILQAAIISALFLVLILKFVKGFSFKINTKNLLSLKSIFFFLLVASFLYFVINKILVIFSLNELINTIISTSTAPFKLATDRGSLARLSMLDALIDKWIDSPIFGHGLNAGAENFLRWIERPWSYELFYVALLMQTGLVGLTIFWTMIYVPMFGFNLNFKSQYINAPMVFYSIPYSILIFFVGAGTNPFWDNYAVLTLLFYFSFKLSNKDTEAEI